jgi:MFS family permease
MVRAQTLVVLAQTLGQIIGSMVSGVFIDLFGLTVLLIIGVVILLISTGVMVACNRSYVRRFPQSQETVN